MTEYRFKVGELVRVQTGVSPEEGGTLVEETFTLEDIPKLFKVFKGVYRVIRLMPVLVGDEPRYLVKGWYGQAERVVGESSLTPAVRSIEEFGMRPVQPR